MTRDEWEALCTRCGKCCYEKVDLGGGVVVYTDEPCKYLDTTTNLCKVYSRRDVVEPDCMSLTEQLVRTLNWLPKDCAYVEHIGFIDTLTEIRGTEKKKRRNPRAKRR
ncbi:MAG: hypothetical protein V2B18_08915 [Pseudomonadota bacterium]